jgi:uncharacterized protein (TIGR00251 family)
MVDTFPWKLMILKARRRRIKEATKTTPSTWPCALGATGLDTNGGGDSPDLSMSTIRVRVKPNSGESVLQENPAGEWTARLKAPPVDGRANEELIALIAAHFGCPKSAVSIRSGASSRLKLVRIDGPSRKRSDWQEQRRKRNGAS